MTVSSLQRVEYPISSDYCRNWGVKEALREIIANMLDARAEHVCSWKSGKAEFEDTGEGFKPNCLMLGEGENKDGEQIGQFREGLKLALLVLASHQREVTLETTGFAVTKAAMEMTGLGVDGLTLYVDHDQTRMRGTVVSVECTKAEYEAALKMFLVFDGGLKRVWSGDSVDIYEANGKRGRIYVNGLLSEAAGTWAFNYNIVGSSVKSSLNRDRNVVERHRANCSVFQVWHSCSDVELIKRMIALGSNGKSYTELSLNWGNPGWHPMGNELPTPWKTAISELVGVPFKDIVVHNGHHAHARLCKEYGYTVISPLDKLGQIGGRLVLSYCPSASDCHSNHAERALSEAKKSGKSYTLGPYEVMAWKDVPAAALDKLNKAAAISRRVCTIFQGTQWLSSMYHDPEYFVYFADHQHPASLGVAYQHKIGVRLSHVEEATISELVGTLIHERAHLMNTKNEDCTREFENVLTAWLGDLATEMASSDEMMRVDVTKSIRSKNRVKVAELDMEDVRLEAVAIGKMMERSNVLLGGKKLAAFSVDPLSVGQLNRLAGKTFGFLSSEIGSRSMTSWRGYYFGRIDDGIVSVLEVEIADRRGKKGVSRTIHMRIPTKEAAVRIVSDVKDNDRTDWHVMPLSEAWPEPFLKKKGLQ